MRYEELLKETASKVRVGEKEGSRFWGRGVRQECPLNPCLFTLLLAEEVLDLDEILEEGIEEG